jgi:hypothetical protein
MQRPSQNPPLPSRRDLLRRGCLLAAAFGLGTACRTWGDPGPDIDTAPRATAAMPAMPATAGPSAEELREREQMRWLANDAPLAELLAYRLQYVVMMARVPPQDDELWVGVRRLCDAVAGGAPIENRRLFSRALAQLIERSDPQDVQGLHERIGLLRSQR